MKRPLRAYRRKGYWKRYIILKDGRLKIDMPRLREAGFQYKANILGKKAFKV